MKRGQMKTWIAKTLKALAKATILAATIIGTSLYLGIKAPQIHGNFLRSHSGSNVFLVLGTGPNQGGGTGFLMQAPSGKLIVISNAHVCDGKDKNGMVKLVGENKKVYIRKVLEMSGWTDLCAIDAKGITGLSGLELGENVVNGQIVTVVGHPSLLPLSLAKGEIIGKDDVTIFEAILSTVKSDEDPQLKLPTITREECSQPKHKIGPKVIQLRKHLTVYIASCYVTTKGALLTTIHVESGNSGSPVVDDAGRVVAVVFAKNEYHKGNLVSYNDLKAFIKKY
jgi:S1-C subfamily serine protease